uniref:Uncharacterized protein n=1 Tax=Spironucleus salmonicida TaxID=348837 RepID=V6LW89_9EUKA|eukprot:EST47976.1 Hypothetical protein SS50377_11888 [Spironucleus salmonicida]
MTPKNTPTRSSPGMLSCSTKGNARTLNTSPTRIPHTIVSIFWKLLMTRFTGCTAFPGPSRFLSRASCHRF